MLELIHCEIIWLPHSVAAGHLSFKNSELALTIPSCIEVFSPDTSNGHSPVIGCHGLLEVLIILIVFLTDRAHKEVTASVAA
jgi:hypothetical protein